MKPSSDKGSSPLELVTLTALLVMPVGLALGLYQQLANELAAESIARHSLRLAMLFTPQKPSQSFESVIERFSKDWQVQDVDYRYWCSLGCSLVTLEIQVGQATAIQSMGLPK